MLRGKDEVLLLDEPDNYLDVPGKVWLEEQLAATPKTVLLVSHDRELLAACAERIITVEDRHVWVHGGGFASYAQARRDRNERLDELRRRWDEEHEKLRQLMLMYRQKASYNADMASRLPGRRDPAAQVRGGRAARGGAEGAERADAAARRPHRQARGDLRAAGADRPDATVRPGGLVRRAGRRARLQRLGQVTFPPPAGRRRERRASGRGQARRPGGAGDVRPDACPARTWRAGRRWTS